MRESYAGRRLRSARASVIAAVLTVLVCVGLAAPSTSPAAYDFVVRDAWIADSWIPGPTARALTQVQGWTVSQYYVCVNAVNTSNNAWAGQTMCGFNTSHDYCGCQSRIGGGHAWPGTVVFATIAQHY
jgi:hypothetical protein